MSEGAFSKPPLTHLKKLSTDLGLYEHATNNEPATHHGYCVDDVSRGLIVLCGETELDGEAQKMVEVFLDFLLKAIAPDGTCHNRMNLQGEWTDGTSNSDWWGRAVWALGDASVHAPTQDQRVRALEGFHKLTQVLPFDLMATTFATLGAGEVYLANPKDEKAERILQAARTELIPKNRDSTWLWPADKFRYSNGSIVQAVLLAGHALKDPAMVETGLQMLDFLLGVETLGDHLSVTPVGGRGPGDPKPAFDQQAIEVGAIAAACAQAWTITKDPRWLKELAKAWGWFIGANDVGCVMFDPETGGGFDGLHKDGPNTNQGAESTIALLTTAQLAFDLVFALA